jgi:protein arginine N-methyltransferase 5
LQDQLSSSSYELFEKDPVKYVQYEKAVRQALAEQHSRSEHVTIMVLGAGRGPLVDVVLRATKGMAFKSRILVIEKNPTAVVTLRHRMRDDWAGHDISVIETDMRRWHAADKADLIVSELLGSWGDNELSPECLDGAQHLLKENGISIPAAYTSYLRPVSSARLHSAVAACVPAGFPELGTRKFFESTYVVRMGSVYYPDQEQPCFTFTHPVSETGRNERFARCTFRMPSALSHCIVHGFRGTFDCTLYGEHHISIAETNHSAGMFCWFPLFLPLEVPLTLKGGEQMDVLLWRKTGSDKVWYEWMVENRTHLHNSGGRSSVLGLN